MHHARWIVLLIALISSSAALPAFTAFQTAAHYPDSQRAWWPTSGTVVLLGGALKGDTAHDFEKRLIALAGGPGAVIVIIPTAWDFLPSQLPTSGPQPSEISHLRQEFESQGAHHIVFLHTTDRQVADSEEFVKVLRSAKAVFFPGGRPYLIEKTYHGTLVERELKTLLDRGGVVAGDSAGALAIGCFALGWPQPYGKKADGLCLLPNTTVECHANAARNFVVTDEFIKYFSAHPDSPTTGIVMDEDTGLVLTGGVAEVFGGQGSVAIIDLAKDKTKPYLVLRAGDKRDLSK